MNRPAPIVIASGPRGRGKSYWLKTQYLPPLGRLWIIDPLREHDGHAVYAMDELCDWIRRGGGAGPFRLVLRVPREDPDSGLNNYDLIMRLAWDVAPVTIVGEEADLLTEENTNRPLPGLSIAIEYGRHVGIAIVGLTRRPTHLPRDLTANADRVLVWRTSEPADLKYWREYLPEGAWRLLPTLGDHAHIDADLWTGTYAVIDPAGAAEPLPDAPL